MQTLKPLFGENGWRRENADLFASDCALRWKLRDEAFRLELIEADALVYQGHRWKATEKMRPVVLGIAKRDALAAVGTADNTSADRRAA